AAFLPRVQERQRGAKGAEQMQQWLLTAKQWALRDRVPTGIRLWQSQQGNKLVRELQYIQQPEVFSQGRIQEVPQPVMTRFPDGTQKPLTRCAFAGANFAGGGVVQAGNFDQAPVQAGDYLEVQGGGLVHRIVAVEDSALYVYPPFDSPIPTGAPYRI